MTYEQRQWVKAEIDRAARERIGTPVELEARYRQLEIRLAELRGERLKPSGPSGGDRVWTDATILDAIRDWVGEHGAPPSSRAWRAPDRGVVVPHASTVVKRFGTFSRAVEAALAA